MEMKEDDRVVGESLHTISKGIHDKVIYLLEHILLLLKYGTLRCGHCV